MTKRRGDQGFTLIELLLVIVVLGVLATIVVASVKGVTAATQETSCNSDARALFTASEAYFAQHPATSIAPVGGSADRFELALVNDGFLHHPSQYYDLDANGALQAASGSPCMP